MTNVVNSVENYLKACAKRENFDLDTMFERVKTIGSLIKKKKKNYMPRSHIQGFDSILATDTTVRRFP